MTDQESIKAGALKAALAGKEFDSETVTLFDCEAHACKLPIVGEDKVQQWIAKHENSTKFLALPSPANAADTTFNIQYWLCNPWFGFGPGAARFEGGVRSTNHRSTTTWIKRIRDGDRRSKNRSHFPIASARSSN